MNITQARKIVEESAAGRKRWGEMYGMGQYSKAQLLDALICVVSDEEEREAMVPKEELTLARRQLTASKARETRLNKINDDLREQILNLQDAPGA